MDNIGQNAVLAQKEVVKSLFLETNISRGTPLLNGRFSAAQWRDQTLSQKWIDTLTETYGALHLIPDIEGPRVLFVTDRLSSVAVSAAATLFLSKKYRLTGVAQSKAEAESLPDYAKTNLIIYVGYQRDAGNYGVHQELFDAIPILAGRIDSCTLGICHKYNIPHLFHRDAPYDMWIQLLDFLCAQTARLSLSKDVYYQNLMAV